MRIGGLAEGRVGRQSEGSTGDATTDESRELAAGEPGRRSEGKDGRATLDASWESAAGRAGRSDDRLDCEIINDETPETSVSGVFVFARLRLDASAPSLAALFAAGWGIGQSPTVFCLSWRPQLVEENGPSTPHRTRYRERYPTLRRSNRREDGALGTLVTAR